MTALDFQVSWPPDQSADTVFDATFGELRLVAAGENLTTYVDDASNFTISHVEQPLYDLAEWVADHWWPLTWEPKKSEDAAEDAGFRSRHGIMAAQHGFALPDVQIVPTGEDFLLAVQPRSADFAKVHFTSRNAHLLSRSSVETGLRQFVDAVVARLPEGLGESLKASWSLVGQTAEEAKDFCRLIGALGLSPYAEHSRIEAALDRMSAILSRDQLFDLCLTAKAEDFIRVASVAERINAAVERSDKLDLSQVEAIQAPADNLCDPAWQRGVTVAHRLREALGIAESDLNGSDKAFAVLGLDWNAKADVDLKGFPSPVVGATARYGEEGRLACLHEAQSGRHFASARALYFFTVGQRDQRRFITDAVTRQQQSSRAFAAELLVPKSYIRARSHKSRVSRDQLHAIAEDAKVAYDLVKFQATNDGLKIAA